MPRPTFLAGQLLGQDSLHWNRNDAMVAALSFQDLGVVLEEVEQLDEALGYLFVAQVDLREVGGNLVLRHLDIWASVEAPADVRLSRCFHPPVFHLPSHRGAIVSGSLALRIQHAGCGYFSWMLYELCAQI